MNYINTAVKKLHKAKLLNELLPELQLTLTTLSTSKKIINSKEYYKDLISLY